MAPEADGATELASRMEFPSRTSWLGRLTAAKLTGPFAPLHVNGMVGLDGLISTVFPVEPGTDKVMSAVTPTMIRSAMKAVFMTVF